MYSLTIAESVLVATGISLLIAVFWKIIKVKFLFSYSSEVIIKKSGSKV